MSESIIQQALERSIFPQSNGRHQDTMRTVIWQLFLSRLRTACGSNTLYCRTVARIRTAHLLLNFIGYTAVKNSVHFISAKSFDGNVRVHDRSLPAVSVLDSIVGQAEVKMAFYATL